MWLFWLAYFELILKLFFQVIVSAGMSTPIVHEYR